MLRFVAVVCRGSSSRSNLVRRHTFQFLQQVPHPRNDYGHGQPFNQYWLQDDLNPSTRFLIFDIENRNTFPNQILHVWPLHKLEGLGADVGAAVGLIFLMIIIVTPVIIYQHDKFQNNYPQHYCCPGPSGNGGRGSSHAR